MARVNREELKNIYAGIKETASALMDEDQKFLEGVKEEPEFKSINFERDKSFFELERILLCTSIITKLSFNDFKDTLEAMNVPLIHKPKLSRFNKASLNLFVDLIIADFNKTSIHEKIDANFPGLKEFIFESLEFYSNEIKKMTKDDNPDTGRILWYLFHPLEYKSEEGPERHIESVVALYYFGSTTISILFGFLPEVVDSYRKGFQ